jgi:hypothetical protein
MRIGKALGLVSATVVALALEPGLALSQVFASSKMTAAFQEHLNSVAVSPGAAFVSSCFGPKGGDMAVLVMPVEINVGTLTHFAARQVYNGAGVNLRNERATIIEGGGGEWSRRKLQFFANKLVSSEFWLESGNQLRTLITTNPEHRCPRFDDTSATPSEN